MNGAVDPYGAEDPYNVGHDTVRSDPEKFMLFIHPWILLGTGMILCVGGLYAGLVYPVLRRYIGYFDRGYAHPSHVFSTVVSAIVGCAFPLGLGLSYMQRNDSQINDVNVGVNDVNGANNVNIIEFVWNLLDYWRGPRGDTMTAYLFYYIYTSFFLMLLMNVTFAFVARWDKISDRDQEPVQCTERHAFIIVAHNSSHKLEKPVRAILKFAKPHQIYVADNGSSENEIQKTRELCRSFSQNDDSHVQVAHLKYGNKTLAQYACVLELLKRYAQGTSRADIVTLIDDDVFIPTTFRGDRIEATFDDDPTKIAIAYPLRIANAERSTYASLQDAEYFTGNVARYVQDILGSQLFASGAIATWKIHQLKHVLERHCTAFNGEDLEMGYLIHKLAGSNSTEKLETEHAVRIGLERNCVVPTVVPVCVFHWYDVLPNPLRRKFNVKACSCGETSFFGQRVRSWDPACHQYLFKFLTIIFSPRGKIYAPKLFIRVLCLWKVVNLIREYMLVAGIFVSFCRLRSGYELVNLLVFYLDCIIVSWGLGILTTISQSMSVSRQNCAIRPDIIFCYPLLLELPYGLIVRPISAFYTYMYYLFFERFPKDIRSQMEADPEKAEALQHVWANSVD